MRAALLVLVLAAVVACAPPVTTGKIVTKQYIPAHSYTETYKSSEICTKTGNVSTCIPIYATRTVYVDDDWSFQLQACEKDECRTGWLKVSHDVYDKYAEGQHYPDAK